MTANAAPLTSAEVDTLIAKQQNAGFAELDLFAQQYPPAVVRELRDSLHELVSKGEAEPVPAVDALGRLNDYLDVCDGDLYNAERARAKMTNAYLTDELHQAIGYTLALLVEHGHLAAWC